jgi:hypothetical protein
MATRLIPVLLMMTMSVPGWTQAQSQLQRRFPLTAQLVAQALSANGIQTVDEQVSLLAQVVATEPAPVLDILSVVPLGSRSPGERGQLHSLVKLGCRLPGACLPFYSIVSKPAVPGSSTPVALGASAVASRTTLKPDTTILIRAGAHATLVMDDARSHVQMSVISLENGIAGHTIHVTSPDRKQHYVAEVVSANLVRRSF